MRNIYQKEIGLQIQKTQKRGWNNLHWRNYYWIGLIKFRSKFLPNNTELISIKYFTAQPKNKEKRSRQAAFFKANKIINGDKFEIIYGQYLSKPVDCVICKQPFSVLEEKRTDINMAIHSITDCFEQKVNMVYLITADSDQVPTMQMIKNKFADKSFVVLFPPKNNSQEIQQITRVHHLNDHEQKFKESVMPTELTDGVKKYTKPKEWNP